MVANHADIVEMGNAMQALEATALHAGRNTRIALRLMELYLDACGEKEHIITASLRACVLFFLHCPELLLPKITLTPDGTLRAHWRVGMSEAYSVEFLKDGTLSPTLP